MALSCASPTTAELVEWSILKQSHCPRGKQVWKKLQLPLQQGARIARALAWTRCLETKRHSMKTEKINPCKCFIGQDKADTHHTTPPLRWYYCKWCLLNMAATGLEMPYHGACMELAGRGLGEWPSPWITAEVSYSPWLHPKPCCLCVICFLQPSLAVLSTCLLPQTRSPYCAQPPPACTPEWVNWFH